MYVGNNVKEMKPLHTISKKAKCKEKDTSETHRFYTIIQTYTRPSHSTLAFHPRETKAFVHTKTDIWIFIAASFITLYMEGWLHGYIHVHAHMHE